MARKLTGISLVLFGLFTTCTLFAGITDDKGQPLVNVCDVANYHDVLALTGGKPPASAILILDMTSLDAKNSGSKAYFFVTRPSDSLVNAVDKQCPLVSSNRDFADVIAALPAKVTPSPARWISSAGQTVWIFALVPGGSDKKIKITETKRRTRIASDLADLFQLAKKAELLSAKIDMIGFPYTLNEALADVTIDVMDKDDKNDQTVFAIKSGPEEHLFLSASLPVNSVKQLKLDDNNKVTSKDTPKEFLIGLNYAVGDVYSVQPRLSLQRIFVTGMVRFSKAPLDTVGAGLGYNSGFANVFAGPIWVRQPRATTPGVTSLSTDMRYKMNWRIGVAFDVKAAMNWVSSK